MNFNLDNWFISPEGGNKEYVSVFFSKIIEQLIDNRSNANKAELVPKIKEEDLFITDFEESHKLKDILEHLSVIYAKSMNASASGYIGQMDSIPNIGSIAGDLVTASINNNMLANEMSPFLTILEQQVVTLFSKWFGFDNLSGGVMTSGGTLANIHALLVARNVKLDIKDGNVYKIRKQPVFFASENSHSSIIKGGMILGIGTENVILIKSTDEGKMSINDLKLKISESLQDGKQPFAIVSTFGTTNSGSLDSYSEIQSICDEYDLWHHIDAVYGGGVILSENQKHLILGCEKADSISFNPQKWMFVSKTCSMLLFKNYKQFKEYFRVAAPYVEQSDRINLGELGIQGSRHTSVLKLWMSLFMIGKKSYGKIIDLNMSLTVSFASFVLQNDFLELYTQPELNILLFRPKNIDSLSKESYNEELLAFQNYLYHENTYISLIPWRGEKWLKCVFLNPYFDQKELEKLKVLIQNYFK